MFDKKTYENSKEAQNSHIATKKIKIWERISNIVGEEGGGGGRGIVYWKWLVNVAF